MDSYSIIAGNKPRFPHANIATTSPISLFVFVCARLRVFYFRNILHIQFAEPDRPPDTAQHNARSATQHSPRTNSHTQSTYRKISAIVQFKKRTRFPFPCQPRFPVTSSKSSKIDPQTDPQFDRKWTPHVDTQTRSKQSPTTYQPKFAHSWCETASATGLFTERV